MKNIIFDIGNVILDFQPEEYLLQYFDKNVMGDLMTIVFSSDEWVNLDIGTCTLSEAINSLTLAHPHYHDELIFFLTHWTYMMVPIPETIQLLYELKNKGYLLYILSNFSTDGIDTLFKRYDFFELFDGAVISSKEKLVKPEEKIYQVLLDRYSLNPSESVFIDDLLANVNTAKRLGMYGIYLPYQTDLRNELIKMNIL
ncbi:HAD family hydrolase [Candidatus Stoquefichus massiliensis]|uniref:HAD family hydrolase n=1 Tax=Candidatus Stoquefichus massiliensis TaxID=1470350 RepID=UPI000489A972|nr:HAD family phosphatase [Candidatus Stoquefichus massiliensis]